MSNSVSFLIYLITPSGSLRRVLLQTNWDTILGKNDDETEKNIMMELYRRNELYSEMQTVDIRQVEIEVA